MATPKVAAKQPVQIEVRSTTGSLPASIGGTNAGNGSCLRAYAPKSVQRRRHYNMEEGMADLTGIQYAGTSAHRNHVSRLLP